MKSQVLLWWHHIHFGVISFVHSLGWGSEREEDTGQWGPWGPFLLGKGLWRVSLFTGICWAHPWGHRLLCRLCRLISYKVTSYHVLLPLTDPTNVKGVERGLWVYSRARVNERGQRFWNPLLSELNKREKSTRAGLSNGGGWPGTGRMGGKKDAAGMAQLNVNVFVICLWKRCWQNCSLFSSNSSDLAFDFLFFLLRAKICSTVYAASCSKHILSLPVASS